jgi:4-hydroxybenzoate polyprenyltransferase
VNERAERKSRLKPAKSLLLAPFTGLESISPLLQRRVYPNPHHWLRVVGAHCDAPLPLNVMSENRNETLSFSDFARAVRMRQWAKNALIFAGFIFAGRLRAAAPEMLEEFARVLLAFVCFCALSSAAYLINDWQDIERDRLHPKKKLRPLASGRMSTQIALQLIIGAILLAGFCCAAIVLLNREAWGFALSALLYWILTLAYSWKLKHEVIVDVLCLSSGFVIRVVAGCLALPVLISPWIIFCTFTLALFIALCKRRAELLEMGDDAVSTRGVLPLYSVPLLDTFIAIAAGLTIMAYSLYTFQAETSTALAPALRDKPLLMVSIPFVVYGVFRFLFLAHSSPVGGEPESALRDKPLMINVFAWTILVAFLTVLGGI